MNLLEHHGKRLLAEAGVATPGGALVDNPAEAAAVTERLGAVVLKSQIPAGQRGKSGGIGFADSSQAGGDSAQLLLGSTINGFEVTDILVEERVEIEREFYAAILNDPVTQGPLVLFSTEGGMDIEDVHWSSPDQIVRSSVNIRVGFGPVAARELLEGLDLPDGGIDPLARTLSALYQLYRDHDAELVEINPLVLTHDHSVVALDCKITLDPGGMARHSELAARLELDELESGTALERRGRKLGMQFIELDGDIGILANGAGLTMATLDAVHYFGGRSANFLEIGGDAYTKATDALRLLLSNPRVNSLLINFCGAFARTDVMAEGVIEAIEELRPTIPLAVTIHGTGEDEAVSLVRDRLGLEPYEHMDEAVKAAVAAANSELEEAGS